MRDPDATMVAEGQSDVEVGADWLVGRYEIGTLIGRGGSGQVHRARDHLTDTDVAVKFVGGVEAGILRQLRRELTALRLLDLPGVVGLLDDGEDGGQTFLVMELLEGGTFGDLAPGGWAAWREQATSLLESLGRVHFAQVVHRDLKPGNVLLDAEGQPVLTDFGLAQGQAVGDDADGHSEGTPRYMAPEQRQGLPCDARTDLFALGRMFAQMLDGTEPPEVAATFAQMQAEDPDERPGSVLEVLQRLGEDTQALLGSVAGLGEASSELELRALFDEPEISFLHLAEDGAAVLHRRTGGQRLVVQAELNRWVRAGLCHWNEGRITIDRAAIQRLQWEDSPVRERVTRLARDRPGALFDEVLALWEDPASRTAPWMGSLLEVVVASGVDVEHQALSHWIELAMETASPLALRRPMYRAMRVGFADGLRLVRAARLGWTGQATRALAMLDTPLHEAILDPWRLATRVHLMGRVDSVRQRMVLEDIRLECRRENVLEGRWHSWAGVAAYARMDFDAALAHHTQAALRLERRSSLLLAALTNGAAAALELADHGGASAKALQAMQLAASIRSAVGEGRSRWLLRAAAYRGRTPLAPDRRLIDAALAVSHPLAAQMAITEAAAAWRLGLGADARELADLAVNIFRSIGHAPGELLSSGLSVAAGGATDALRWSELEERTPAYFCRQAEVLRAWEQKPTAFPQDGTVLRDVLSDGEFRP